MSRTIDTNGAPASGTEILSVLHTLEPDRRIVGRNRTKADILLYRRGGVDLAVKDYSARSWLVRNTVGRLSTRREAAAYRAAEGAEGLPRFLGRLGPFALVTHAVDGEPLATTTAPVDGAVFDRVERIVQRLHERGVALADLHWRDVLVGPDATIWVVDLAAAFVLGKRPGRIRRAVFDRCRDADRVALARMRARFTGGDIDAAVDAVGGRAAAWHRRGRRLKRLLRRLRLSRR